jgi:hypothetical protein
MLASAFGLSLSFETPPPGAWGRRPEGEPSLRVRLATPQDVADAWSGRESIGWEAAIDGAPFLVERGQAGDHRFVHGERSVHHLSADAVILLRAADDDGEPAGWRVTLDSVLFSIALIFGFEALHAGAVATDKGAIAVTAGPGGGKSTLLAELLRGGCSMLSDDVVVLESRGDASPLAHPGAPLMTVPATIDPLPGTPIAAVGEERWVAVPTHREAIPLANLVVLNRRPGLDTGLHRVENPLVALMASLLRFPRSPERERARFEIAGAIASHVPVWELRADPSVGAKTLASLLRARLVG